MSIKVALVGCGGIGRKRAKLIADTEGVELAAICDRKRSFADSLNHELGGTTQVFESISEMINSIGNSLDCVFIMTPSGVHAANASMFLQKNINVVCTKPLDVTVERCRAIVDTVPDGVFCAVDMQERYKPINQRIKRAIDQKVFGKTLLIEGRLKWFRGPSYYSEWRGTWEMDGGGCLANNFIHNLDLMRWFGGPIQSVYGRYMNGAHPDGCEADDLFIGTIQFVGGVLGTLMATTTWIADPYVGVEVHGTDGAVSTIKEEHNKFSTDANYFDTLPLITKSRNIVENVRNYLEDGEPLLTSAQEGLETVELMRALYDSAKD